MATARPTSSPASARSPAAPTSAPPPVAVYSGAGGQMIRSFFAYDQGFVGGVVVGFAPDRTGDKIGEIVVGSGNGAPSDVRVLDGASLALLQRFTGLDSGDTTANLSRPPPPGSIPTPPPPPPHPPPPP